MHIYFIPSLIFCISTFGSIQADLHSTDDQDSPVSNYETSSPSSKIEPFTGKITRNKVRMRLQPSLDALILRELARDDLISVIGENDEFYAVLPPKDIKAYIFRTLILDNIVEGQKVNVRLEPALEAPIIAQLHQGDKVEGTISPLNSKWLEITPPDTTRFYVCKEYVEKIGPVEMIGQLEKRLGEANALISAARISSENELQKPYKEMNLDMVFAQLNKVIKQYSEFPSHVASAKELLANIQSIYLEKKIAYLESKAGDITTSPSNPYPGSSSDQQESDNTFQARPPQEKKLADWSSLFNSNSMPAKMAAWIPNEKVQYELWRSQNGIGNGTVEEFYLQQLNDTMALQGILENYSKPIRNKPGDYVLVNPSTGLPIAFLYSTRVNLNEYLGHEVVVHGLKRDNYNFAFPAYFVITVE